MVHENSGDVLGYSGRVAVVTGAGSGMGLATANLLIGLGARVHAVDVRDPGIEAVSFHQTDLRDPSAIATTVSAISRVDALFNCAGLPTTAAPRDVLLVSFCGLRALTEGLIPKMGPGSAIASVASLTGLNWVEDLPWLFDLLATDSFEAGVAWVDANADRVGDNAYGVAKEAINAYTALRSFDLASSDIRINCINPGPTDTPMLPHFVESMGSAFMDGFPRPLGRNSTPEEQAWPLVFLNSPRASYITGISLNVDAGFTGGLLTGQIDPAALMPSS